MLNLDDTIHCSLLGTTREELRRNFEIHCDVF